jgi:uncharacterized protein YdeI (YjbR/CyaY-like superfamily)
LRVILETTKEITYFKSAAEFRNWLKKNYAVEKELFVGFYKKDSGKKGITYKEAVNEALCFGWIDGVIKKVDELSYMHRFSPRKPVSIWSVVNTKRAEELIELGQMHPSGLKVFKDRDKNKTKLYAFENMAKEFDSTFLNLFKKNTTAWNFFQQQAPWYKKVAVHWVTSAKREETRLRRFNQLLQDSANLKRLKIVTLEKE